MIDKRLAFSVTIFIIMNSQSVFSQKTQLLIARNSVGKLQAAIANKKDVKTQMTILSDGIKASELTAKDSKTRKWGITWAIKSYLSSYIAITDPDQVNSNKHYDLALQAIDSAKKYNKYEDDASLITAANYNINIKKQQKGNLAYADKDYKSAFEYLKQVSDFFPKDTVMAMNAALSAEGVKNEEEAFNFYKRAKDNNVRNPVVFQRLADLYKEKSDKEKALKTIQEGLSLNPYNDMLNNDYINMLLDDEKYDQAKDVIDGTLKVETRSKMLYYLFGYLHQKNANMTTAELAYNKSLDIDHNFFDALYQLGLVYVDLGNKALDTPVKDVPKFASYLNRAEVVLLQAHQVNPKDKSTINVLIDIYTRKNRFDRVQELKAQLDGF